jgi:hypothetical protein
VRDQNKCRRDLDSMIRLYGYNKALTEDYYSLSLIQSATSTGRWMLKLPPTTCLCLRTHQQSLLNSSQAKMQSQQLIITRVLHHSYPCHSTITSWITSISTLISSSSSAISPSSTLMSILCHSSTSTNTSITTHSLAIRT